MTVDEVREMRKYIMANATRNARPFAFAVFYARALDEIARNPNGDECCALARAAIGANDGTS